MPDPNAQKIAAQCRHYAMCKIDYLGTGLCPSAKDGNYVSYYPQGRMDLYRAIAARAVPVTPLLFDIADSCTLCGICDKQCYFITGLRPLRVMQALKEFVADYRAAKKTVAMLPADPILAEFKNALGEKWATHDPAILVAYADDPCPLAAPVLPRFVVLPGTREEMQAVVRLCLRHGLSYAVRGNGSSVIGLVMSPGVVIDTNRMRSMRFDAANWCVQAGPGVSAFELQQQASRLGYRVNVAEPAAMVAANMMCTGIFSLFSAAYGIGADNCVNAEFVGPDGEFFSLNDRAAPNLFSYRDEERGLPGICTSVSLKLHPVFRDEEGLLVPFSELKLALAFAHTLSQRRIGTALGVLGGEYVSVFMSPNNKLAFEVRTVISEKLGIQYLVLVIGDQHTLQAVRSLGVTVIDNKLFRLLMLAFPKLVDSAWTDILAGISGDRPPYEWLGKAEMRPLLEAALAPAADVIAGAVDEDLREFFTRLYERPEMTDLVWLTMFRILSSRMGRDRHVLAVILYVPLHDLNLIEEIHAGLKETTAAHGIRGEYGFITPLDEGKRAVFEFDCYFDHTSEEERARAKRAFAELAAVIGEFSRRVPAVRWFQHTPYQGFCRSEHLLYT